MAADIFEVANYEATLEQEMRRPIHRWALSVYDPSLLPGEPVIAGCIVEAQGVLTAILRARRLSCVLEPVLACTLLCLSYPVRRRELNRALSVAEAIAIDERAIARGIDGWLVDVDSVDPTTPPNIDDTPFFASREADLRQKAIALDPAALNEFEFLR